MSQSQVLKEVEDDNAMHHRVARLSITVDDDSYKEHQKFLTSLKSQSENQESSAFSGDEETPYNVPVATTNERFPKSSKKRKNEKRKQRKLQKKLERQQQIENGTALLREMIDNSNQNTSAIDDDDDDGGDGNGNDNGNRDNIPLHLLAKERGSKRRRSSAALNVGMIVRKKKFLNDKPKLTVLGDRNKKASISSIRDLLLYSLTDMDLVPRWCNLTNRRSVDKFVIVFLRGLTNKEFGMPDLKKEVDPLLISKYNLNGNLDSFGKHFKEVIPMIAPGSKKCIYSTYSSLVSYTLSNKQKAAIQKENENRKIVLPDLYLTLEELLFNNYPIHKDVPGATTEMIDKTSDYKSTVNFHHDGSRTFALDCEMCLSVNGRVLTRVSLCDFDNNVIVDKLIKPDEPIIDYLTQYSGITEEMLEGVETTVEDIQEELLSIISSNDTLIGHSLESDLSVLKIKHPFIVDTSVCYDHPRGPPSKASLKMLMSTHLDTAIQKSFSGHDSVEDCISCMELVKLKIAKGYLYGKSYNMESLFKRIAQNNKLVKTAEGEKIPKKSLVVGYSPVKNFGHHETQVQCNSDDEIVDKFVELQPDNDLIILKMRELEWFKNFSQNNIVEGLKLPDDVNEMYRKVNDRMEKIYDNLAPNSILVVCSENGDTREMLRLQSQTKVIKFKVEKDTEEKPVHVKDEKFTEDTWEQLGKALDEARDTLFLCTLKPSDFKPSASTEPESLSTIIGN
ncbi:uncharacterized protein C5L36_0B01390 [Pichia kudriavzevii]|uniref:Exonuclease domain-containing protein n=1 Tax=Pichia kudriavzevii TaxID=4909 RepID=A0A2U9R0R9_PICKU|nr:uncharacterized protein C5L36_0B01390 [Pichia kudriavzevii]AWU74874.1 hypothetical protein C5L36_0B01390 [Pichia kudriavzevii]